MAAAPIAAMERVRFQQKNDAGLRPAPLSPAWFVGGCSALLPLSLPRGSSAPCRLRPGALLSISLVSFSLSIAMGLKVYDRLESNVLTRFMEERTRGVLDKSKCGFLGFNKVKQFKMLVFTGIGVLARPTLCGTLEGYHAKIRRSARKNYFGRKASITLPPTLNVASDATVEIRIASTSLAINDKTRYFNLCTFHHSKALNELIPLSPCSLYTPSSKYISSSDFSGLSKSTFFMNSPYASHPDPSDVPSFDPETIFLPRPVPFVAASPTNKKVHEYAPIPVGIHIKPVYPNEIDTLLQITLQESDQSVAYFSLSLKTPKIMRRNLPYSTDYA
ncbi:hypothetical protein LXL04_030777 [Taraxacum kok-saghyz]